MYPDLRSNLASALCTVRSRKESVVTLEMGKRLKLGSKSNSCHQMYWSVEREPYHFLWQCRLSVSAQRQIFFSFFFFLFFHSLSQPSKRTRFEDLIALADFTLWWRAPYLRKTTAPARPAGVASRAAGTKPPDPYLPRTPCEFTCNAPS